jgi:hypothetical protein
MLNLNLQPATEARLRKIYALYDNDEHFAQYIIDAQTQALRKTLSGLRLDLQAFEQRYQMESSVFYPRFQAGEMGDAEDFIIWAGVYELLRDNQQQLAELSRA